MPSNKEHRLIANILQDYIKIAQSRLDLLELYYAEIDETKDEAFYYLLTQLIQAPQLLPPALARIKKNEEKRGGGQLLSDTKMLLELVIQQSSEVIDFLKQNVQLLEQRHPNVMLIADLIHDEIFKKKSADYDEFFPQLKEVILQTINNFYSDLEQTTRDNIFKQSCENQIFVDSTFGLLLETLDPYISELQKEIERLHTQAVAFEKEHGKSHDIKDKLQASYRDSIAILMEFDNKAIKKTFSLRRANEKLAAFLQKMATNFRLLDGNIIASDFKTRRFYAELKIELNEIQHTLTAYKIEQQKAAESAKQLHEKSKTLLTEEQIAQKRELEQKIVLQKKQEEEQRIETARIEAERIKKIEEQIAISNAQAAAKKRLEKEQKRDSSSPYSELLSSSYTSSSPGWVTETFEEEEDDDSDYDEQELVLGQKTSESSQPTTSFNNLLAKLSKTQLKNLHQILIDNENSAERHLRYRYADIKKIATSLGAKTYKSHTSGSGRRFKFEGFYTMISITDEQLTSSETKSQTYTIHQVHHKKSRFVEGVCVKNFCQSLARLQINKENVEAYINASRPVTPKALTI